VGASREPIDEKILWVDCLEYTIGNKCSFIGTDEYIQIIFVGFETDVYKVIFVGLGRTRQIYGLFSLTLTGPLYSSVTWPNR
jgi:hypothetical protein